MKNIYFFFALIILGLLASLGCDKKEELIVGGPPPKSGVFVAIRNYNSGEIPDEARKPSVCSNSNTRDSRIQPNYFKKGYKFQRNFIFSSDPEKGTETETWFNYTVLRVETKKYVVMDKSEISEDSLKFKIEDHYEHFFDEISSQWKSRITYSDQNSKNRKKSLEIECYGLNASKTTFGGDRYATGEFILKSGQRVSAMQLEKETKFGTYICEAKDKFGKVIKFEEKDVIHREEIITADSFPNLKENCQRAILYEKHFFHTSGEKPKALQSESVEFFDLK